jgi:hypothetical protein
MENLDLIQQALTVATVIGGGLFAAFKWFVEKRLAHIEKQEEAELERFRLDLTERREWQAGVAAELMKLKEQQKEWADELMRCEREKVAILRAIGQLQRACVQAGITVPDLADLTDAADH